MEVAKRITDYFFQTTWPPSIVVTGKNTSAKSDFIKNLIARALHENLLPNLDMNYHDIGKMVYRNEHPDYYFFPGNPIKIGKDSSEIGTIRHLLKTFLPYSGYKSRIRLVYFEDASLIHSEAESALLKSIEEPPSYVRFILSVTNTDSLKHTILSRSIQVPYHTENIHSLPSDPWDAFWQYTGYHNDSVFLSAEKNEWTQILKKNYDQLSYNNKDYLIFEQIGWTYIRSHFKKFSGIEQMTLLKIAFLPLYFALRDRIIYGGMIPSISPVIVPFQNKKKLFCAFYTINHFFKKTETRIFGSLPLSHRAVFYSFLSKFMHCWQIPEKKLASAQKI